MSKQQFQPRELNLLAQLPELECVRCDVSGFGSSHDYVFTHPAALSDLKLAAGGSVELGADGSGRDLDAPRDRGQHSAALPWRDLIIRKLEQGLCARRIHHDLQAEQGYLAGSRG